MWRGVFAITDREAQIEALWTYEISTEKVLKRAVKKGFITQEEADEFSERLFEQLNTDHIPGFRPSHLGEKMRMEDIRVNPYVSLTEIAREKKSSSPSYLIQSWLAVPRLSTCGCGRKFTTPDFRRMLVISS